MKIQKNFKLASLTTFGIGGTADFYVEVKKIKELILALKWAKEKKIPYFILGGGSNVLIADEGLRGLVIKMKNLKFKFQASKLFCEAGVLVNKIVKESLKVNLAGLEYFAGLPGTVGGAIYKNSHWHEHFFSDNLVQVTILDENLKKKKIKKNKLSFAYNWSSFQEKKWIIWEAEFQLKKDKTERLKQKVKEVLEHRKQQPQGKSAGCIFKNPEGESAGRLIEKAGLKGKRIGGIEISPKHANFFINLGGGTAKEVRQLISLVQHSVKNKFGVNLEPEIFFLGGFYER